MKKLLIICILIVSVIFISGCTSDDKTNSESFSSDSQQSNIQETKLILNRGDVPGFTLHSYHFKYHTKVTEYYLGDGNPWTYSDVLPDGQRNVGQRMKWSDEEGHLVVVDLTKYDSNSGFEDFMKIDSIKQMQEMYGIKDSEINDFLIQMEFEEGEPKIGDNSHYSSMLNYNSDKHMTGLIFTYNNYLCNINVLNVKEQSKNEAIRIAELIESRLD